MTHAGKFLLCLALIYTAPWDAHAQSPSPAPVIVHDQIIMSDLDLVRAKMFAFSDRMNDCLDTHYKADYEALRSCLCNHRNYFYGAYTGLSAFLKDYPALAGKTAQYTPPGEAKAYTVDLTAYAATLRRYEPHVCK